jgi:putative peptidoglycan lipid II flippase
MKRVAFDSAIVTILNLLGQIASFVLFAGIAALFGANADTDAFFLALTIPSLFIGSAVNAITSVFIPVLTEYRIRQPDELGRLVGSALLFMATLSAVALLITVPAASSIIRLTGGGFSAETQQLAAGHLLLLTPLIATQTLIGVLAAVFNAAQRFVLPSAAMVVRHLATLLLIWALRPMLGTLSLSVAFVLGTGVHLLLLVAFLPRLQIRISFHSRITRELLQPFRLALPLIGGTAALQLGIILSRFLAAQLPPGSVSILDYATRISSAVIEILTSGVFLVTLADWSRLVAEGVHEELRHRLRQTVLVVLFFVTPVVAALLVLREPIIVLLLQRGAFDSSKVAVTSQVLALLLLGIPIDVIGRAYVRLFLVWHETLVIGALAALRLVILGSIALILTPTLGLIGIALAENSALLIITLCLVLLANRRLGNTFAGLWLPITKIAIASSACAAAMTLATGSLQQASVFVIVPLATLIGAICYVATSWLLRIQELAYLFQLISDRLAKDNRNAQVG